MTKEHPSSATTDPNETYDIKSQAQGMFSSLKIPRNLKGSPFPGSLSSSAVVMG
jgi:hypothetical protein